MKKKLMSLVLAMTMILSALPAAAAASTEPLSEKAGEVVLVQVVEETKSGLTSRIIHVAIPENATKAEADTLVNAAALRRASGGIQPLNASSEFYYIDSVDGSIKMWHNEEARIGGGTPVGASYSDLDQIAIYFTVEDVSHSKTRVGFELRSMTTPSSTTGWKEIQLHEDVWKAIFYTNEFELLSNYDDGIDVYAKTMNNDMAIISGITILGT